MSSPLRSLLPAFLVIAISLPAINKRDARIEELEQQLEDKKLELDSCIASRKLDEVYVKVARDGADCNPLMERLLDGMLCEAVFWRDHFRPDDSLRPLLLEACRP